MPTMRKLRSTENSVTYANPANIGDTLKVTTEVKQKSVSGVSLANVSNTFVSGTTNKITVAGTEIADANSVRVYISGSPQSSAALKARFMDVVVPAVTAALDGDCQLGFVPDNLTINIS